MNFNDLSKEELIKKLETYHQCFGNLPGSVCPKKKKQASACSCIVEPDYRLLADQSPNMIFINVKGRVVYANRKCEEVMGYTLEEFCSEDFDFLKLISPKSIDQVKANLDSHLKGKAVEPYECTLITKDGREIVALIASCITEFGDVSAIQGIVTDITELKDIENKLSKSEREIRSLVEMSLVGIFKTNLKGEIFYVNKACLDIFGYDSEEEMMAGKVLKFYKDPDRRDQIMNKLLESGLIKGEYIEAVSSTGESKHVLLSGTIDGEAITGMLMDISERRQALDSLKESEEKFRKLAEEIPNMIFILKISNNKIVFANRLCEETLGFTRNIFYSDDFDYMKLVLPEYRDLLMVNFDRRKKGFEVEPYEIALVAKNGEIINALFNARIITYEGENALLGIITNITARQRIDKELQKIEKLECIGRLAGGIAHDFNNLLTGIMGNLSLALRLTQSGSKLSTVLERADEACTRAQSLTGQLITFSKGGEPVKRIYSVAGLVRDSVNLVLSGSNVKCEFLLDDDLLPVEVDREQLDKAIHNLVTNADQAMPNGGVIRLVANNFEIEGGHALPLKAGSYVKITISDGGKGIKKENLPNIFDPFFSSKTNGTGLGLSTAYAIIKKHNGHIDIESSEGKGTNVHIYLPAATSKSASMQPLAEDSTEGNSSAADFNEANHHVLVMDDEEIVRDVLGDMLKMFGCEVDFAENGSQALEKYSNALSVGKRYTMVIMDLTIPGEMGGREAVIKLREIDPEVKAVVSSGYSNDPIMANFSDFGFDDVIPKPYRIEDLKAIIDKIITHQPESD